MNERSKGLQMAKQKNPPSEKTETQAEYRQRIMDIICAATANSDKGLKRICDALREENPEVPTKRAIQVWIEKDTDLFSQYARAKEMQADFIFEQIIDIADDDSQDAIFIEADEESGKTAKMVKNKEFMERSKLRVDARKWVVSKLLPKKYGDRVEQVHSGTLTLEQLVSGE